MTIAMNLAANPLMQYAIDPLRELLCSRSWRLPCR